VIYKPEANNENQRANTRNQKNAALLLHKIQTCSPRTSKRTQEVALKACPKFYSQIPLQ